METSQPGIMLPVPSHCRYLEFGLVPGGDIQQSLAVLARREATADAVIGLGPGLVKLLGGRIDALHPFPAISGPGCEVPSTQADLWIWLRGSDRGHLANSARLFRRNLEAGFRCDRVVDGFKFDSGRDLSGYEDGTENPKGDLATDVALVTGAGAALDGSSFVAVQQWVHELDRFAAMSPAARDASIGRRISDNVEMAGAPPSSHVKRTAQESFDPPAFVWRRSMPWADSTGEGLMFVAFANSFYAFEAQLRRMAGQEDGILDALFRFSRPVSGSHFWCPPVAGGRLNLSAVGF